MAVTVGEVLCIRIPDRLDRPSLHASVRISMLELLPSVRVTFLLTTSASTREQALEIGLLALCSLLLLRLEYLLRALSSRLSELSAGLSQLDRPGQRRARAARTRGAADKPDVGEQLELAEVEHTVTAAEALLPQLLRVPGLTPEQSAARDALRAHAAALPELEGCEVLRAHFDDACLARYVLARVSGARRLPNLSASLKMVRSTAAWRAALRPHELSCEEVVPHAACGKCYVGGIDVHGRPVIVLDNDKENLPAEHDGQMRHLAFNLEYATRLLGSQAARAGAGGRGATRFLVFVKLGDFKLSSCPPMHTTLATVQMVCDHFPERLGQCVLYQPPSAFVALWAVARRVLTQETLEKITFVHGDASPGSEHDEMLCAAIGPRWRELTGADQPYLKPGCSSGYGFEYYWRCVQADEKRWRAGETPLGPSWPHRAAPTESSPAAPAPTSLP